MRKDDVTLRARRRTSSVPSGTELVIDSEYNQASVEHPVTITQITTSLQWLTDDLFKYYMTYRQWFYNTDYQIELARVFHRANNYLQSFMTHHVRKHTNRFSVELAQQVMPAYRGAAYPLYNPPGISGAAVVSDLPTAGQVPKKGAERIAACV